MARYKVEWSAEARLDILDILEFYFQRNGNAKYCRKFIRKINKTISIVSKNPLLGIRTDIESVRAIITGDYEIIYEVIEKTIVISMVWDCRRNPEDKNINTRNKK